MQKRQQSPRKRSQKSRNDTYSESSSTVGSVCAERVAARCVARFLADLYDHGSFEGRSRNAELRCGERRGDDCGEVEPDDVDVTEDVDRDASSHS